jgi:hypothetical protein
MRNKLKRTGGKMKTVRNRKRKINQRKTLEFRIKDSKKKLFLKVK